MRYGIEFGMHTLRNFLLFQFETLFCSITLQLMGCEICQVEKHFSSAVLPFDNYSLYHLVKVENERQCLLVQVIHDGLFEVFS
jgi:hypothetical protein